MLDDVMRVLLTGMSGTGKSALVHELRHRGYPAYDADDDGFSERRSDGRWGWRLDLVARLLDQETEQPLFFAGCSEEQIDLPFDYRVLLTAPRSVLIDRLHTRTGNTYGRTTVELTNVLADLAEVEPLLRRSADLVLSTTAPVAHVADRRRAASPLSAAVARSNGHGRAAAARGRERSSGGWQARALRAGELFRVLPPRPTRAERERESRRRVPLPDRTRRPGGPSLARRARRNARAATATG